MKTSYQTIVLALLCLLAGFTFWWQANSPAVAQSPQATEPQGQTYQISAFGGSDSRDARYGAYVLNTQTGKVWLIKESNAQLMPILGTPPK
jgi:hypothetical protein